MSVQPRCRLVSLPLEVSSLLLEVSSVIAGLISTGKKNLLAACYSRKSLYAAAVPYLYHRSMVKEDTDIAILAAMLSPDNMGLLHI